uniref:Uncharacterized protein n=1 Tax=Sphaerodactylus townsendi TaxID=933632 RepID=A0ACB8F0B9_9SAUR
MASKDGAAGGSPAGEPDEGTGRVSDEDEMPRDQDDPHFGAARSNSDEESMGSPYSWVSSRRPCWGAKAAGRCESTWRIQPMDQDIYSEWDPVAQSEWSRVQVQARAWAPERGTVAWRREQDKMRQEIHFLWRNMELLLAPAEAAKWDRQDLLQLPLSPLEGEQLVPAPPNDGPPGPQPPQPLWRQRHLKGHLSDSRWQGGQGISLRPVVTAGTLSELQRRGAQSSRVS